MQELVFFSRGRKREKEFVPLASGSPRSASRHVLVRYA